MEIIEEIWDSFEKISTYIKIEKFLDIEKIDKPQEEVINAVYNIFDKLQEKNQNENENENPKTINKEPKEPNLIIIFINMKINI